MTYTTPTTRVTGELITAAIWNTDIVDNLTYLLARPATEHTANEGSNYTTNSSSWADVDATDYALTLDVKSGAVLVGFNGTVDLASNASGPMGHFDVDVDGARHEGDDGIIGCQNFNVGLVHSLSFAVRIDGLSVGSHTFKLQWKATNTGGTPITLFAGAGTSARDVHPQFWVQEV